MLSAHSDLGDRRSCGHSIDLVRQARISVLLTIQGKLWARSYGWIEQNLHNSAFLATSSDKQVAARKTFCTVGTAQDHVSARYQPSNTYTDYKYWQDSEQLGPTAPKPIMTSDNAADPPLDSHQQLTKNFAVLQSKILKRLEKTITGLVEEKLDSIRSEVKSEIAKCHGEFVSIAGGLRQPQHQDLGVERTVGPSKSTDLVHHTFSTAPQSSLLDRSEGQGVSEFESNKETAYIPPHKRGWTNFSNQRYVRTREHMPQDSSSEEAAPQGRQDSLECTDLPDALRQTREICDIHHNFEALKQAYLPKFKEACEQQGTMRYESPAERYTSEGQEQALHCASSVTSVEERSVSEWQSLSDLESHPEYSVLYDFEYVDELWSSTAQITKLTFPWGYLECKIDCTSMSQWGHHAGLDHTCCAESCVELCQNID